MASDKEVKLLSAADGVRVELVSLFRKYGYDGYKMAKFESYEVYQKNKDYIGSESIVTFTDSTGKLMALRPDVTLSIVNNLGEGAKKYYYDENVFRRDARGDYREIRQIGIENVGGEGAYPEYEVVALAVKTLKTLGAEYALCIGNMDVVDAMMNELGLSGGDRAKAIGFIKAKAFHELKKLPSVASSEKADKLCRLVSFEGDMASVIEEARALFGTSVKALDEMSELCDALSSGGLGDRVKADFSIINDFAYYSGINFRGYVKGVATAVISGGRYDKMTERMGKNVPALGFALDFDAVLPLLRGESETEVLIIGGNAPVKSVARLVEKYTAEGKRTLVVKTDDGKIAAAKRVYAEETNNA